MNFNDKVRAVALRLIGNNNAIINAAAEATEPKVYVALLTQSGTDAPVATVLKNTLGVTPSFNYNIGVYAYMLPFDIEKTRVTYSPGSSIALASQLVHAYNYDDGGDNVLEIITKNSAGNAANDMLINFNLKIEVYP